MAVPHHSRSAVGKASVIGLFFAILLAPLPVTAAPLTVSVSPVSGYPGQRVEIPVSIAADVDSIAGFVLSFTLDRPGVLSFVADTITDTLTICTNPPSCTVIDTTIDTVAATQLDAAGSLCENWDYLRGVTFGNGFDVHVTGVASFIASREEVILPLESGLLFKLVADINCHQDPFNEGEVECHPNPLFSNFSDPSGSSITTFTMDGALFTVLDPVMCDLDYSGSPDAADLNLLIGYLFFGEIPACDAIPVDFNCDTVLDAGDLNTMIEYLFFGSPVPSCP